jgi:RNA polymerase sigma-70 factor (ECF subfamily)
MTMDTKGFMALAARGALLLRRRDGAHPEVDSTAHLHFRRAGQISCIRSLPWFESNPMPLSDSSVRVSHAKPEHRAPDGGGVEHTAPAVSLREIPDVELVVRMARQEAPALAEFYDRHGAVLYSLALRILTDTHAAEHTIQEAMAVVWETAPAYSTAAGTPLSWAVALTRQAAISRLRARQVTATPDSRPATPTTPAADSRSRASAPSSSPAASRVREAIDQLHREQREAVEMAFFGGIDQTELAARLGVSLNQARTLLRHALMTLRDAAEGQI